MFSLKNLLVAGLALGLGAGLAKAGNVSLTASDAGGTSSFNSAGNWNNAAAPTAGNGYYTQGFILRSPADANPYTFAGSALSIDAYTPGAGGRFLMKGPGGATITITNLILNGGLVDYADPVTGNETLAGMITLNGGTTSYLGAFSSSSLSVTAPISGTGNLQIGGANVNAGADVGTVIITGTNSYTGNTTDCGRNSGFKQQRLARQFEHFHCRRRDAGCFQAKHSRACCRSKSSRQRFGERRFDHGGQFKNLSQRRRHGRHADLQQLPDNGCGFNVQP